LAIINKKYWHKGYASEASQFMRDYFFENTDFVEVYSYMNKENYPSVNVAKKNGMLFVEEYYEEDVLYVVYKITKEQWEKTKANI